MPPLHLRKYWLPLVLVPVLMGIASSAQGQPPGGDPRWKNQGPQLPTKKFNAEEYFAKQSESMKATMATNEKAQAESFAKNWRFTSILATPLLWIAVALTLFSIGAWIYVRLSATTNPRTLAASDPWIRDRLAQGQAGSEEQSRRE